MLRVGLNGWARALIVIVVAGIGVLLPTGVGEASTCTAANPNDSFADDAALQSCLNAGGTITLDPGSPGYVIATGLNVPLSNTTVQSSSLSSNATLVAGPALSAPILRVAQNSGINHLTVQRITFDGNRPARTVAASCIGASDRSFGNDVDISSANGLRFDNNTVTRTVCGSSLHVIGSNMTISNNTITDNGHGRESGEGQGVWADGITLAFCKDSTVTGNTLIDNTDVAIANFDGTNCNISNNTVQQVSRHAFSGISFGGYVQQGLSSDHTNSLISGNNVTSASGMLSFGISVGVHPWNPNNGTQGGTVKTNTVSGAIVNLIVDGSNFSTIGTNMLSAPTGTATCGGTPVNLNIFAPHTVGTTTSMVPDAVRSYDGCIP